MIPLRRKLIPHVVINFLGYCIPATPVSNQFVDESTGNISRVYYNYIDIENETIYQKKHAKTTSAYS